MGRLAPQRGLGARNAASEPVLVAFLKTDRMDVAEPDGESGNRGEEESMPRQVPHAVARGGLIAR